MTARFADHILAADVLANRPAASEVPVGALYPATDTGIIYQSDGTSWATWRPAAEALPAGGTTAQVLTKLSAADGDADWADAAGGGSSSDAPLQAAALDPTHGDHFSGGALDARWNRVGYVAGDETWDDPGGSWLTLLTARASGNYYWQAPPAGDFTAVMSCVIQATGGVMFGLLAIDSASSGIASGVYFNEAGTGVFQTNAAGAYTGGNIYTGISSGVGMGHWEKVWFRLRKVGSTYYAASSSNGEVWSREVSQGGPSAPNRLGFGAFYGTPVAFAVDYFNVV